MNDKRVIGLMGPACLALVTGSMWIGGATPGNFALVGLGAAVAATVCLISDF